MCVVFTARAERRITMSPFCRLTGEEGGAESYQVINLLASHASWMGSGFSSGGHARSPSTRSSSDPVLRSWGSTLLSQNWQFISIGRVSWPVGLVKWRENDRCWEFHRLERRISRANCLRFPACGNSPRCYHLLVLTNIFHECT